MGAVVVGLGLMGLAGMLGLRLLWDGRGRRGIEHEFSVRSIQQRLDQEKEASHGQNR
ncbi:MAG: hypothetical protein JWQ81_1641 [Amycolatopsis sp.]|uniref:hypothetical protein n=1 Tax=Amycolatopsis sp. TaxID=37632 RepID=UPI002624FCF6|nr:hypothetical protein [Amycolatopsis sp.]MCU1680902.1 hypothetical protein [Amycolatopsis sp.]